MLPGIITAILLAAFIGGVVWLFFFRRASDFEQAERSPLEDNDLEKKP